MKLATHDPYVVYAIIFVRLDQRVLELGPFFEILIDSIYLFFLWQSWTRCKLITISDITSYILYLYHVAFRLFGSPKVLPMLCYRLL